MVWKEINEKIETFQFEENVPDEGVDCKGREYKRIEVGKRNDITNEKFNQLLALFPVKSERGRKWLFKCDCGNITVITAADVKNGHTKSCGCFHKGSQIINLKRKNFWEIKGAGLCLHKR